MNTKRLFTGMFELAVGLPFLVVGLVATAQMVRLRRRGVRARAKIVAYETSGDGDARYPVVEFHDRDGMAHRVQLAASATTGKDGLTRIVYDPQQPSLARGLTFAHTWLVPLVGVLLGGGLTLLGILTLLGTIPEE